MGRATYAAMGLSVPVTDMIDPVLWQERYAWGVPLGSGTGGTLTRTLRSLAKSRDVGKLERLLREIPPHVIRWHLRTAVSELEIKLGTPFGMEIVKTVPVDEGLQLGVDYDRKAQRLPYTTDRAMRWFRIDLPSGVIRIDRIRGYYYGTNIWTLDTPSDQDGSMIRLEWGANGIAHILPVNMQAIMVTQGGNYGVWHTLNLHQSPVPDFWAVDYTRGPVSTQGGQPGQVEAVLAHWVYCTAGMHLLSMAGIGASRGVSSSSISIDGLSRSVGLQASAIYGLNSALEHMMEQATKRIDWKQLRAHKRGMRVWML